MLNDCPIFRFGTTLVISKELTPGTVFAVFWAFMGSVFAIGQLTPQIPILIGAMHAAVGIFEVIDRVGMPGSVKYST